MRDRLLPPNYSDLAVWKDLADAIDAVFKARIDNPQKLFPLLRDIFPYRYAEWGQTLPTGLFDKTNLYPFPKEEYILVNNLLGFSFSNSLFDREDFQALSSNVSHYYAQKGSENFMDFFGYCLGAQFDAKVLWTDNYTDFYQEGDPLIGLPIYSGGTWYPTSTVDLVYDFIKFGIFSPYEVTDFFYYVAPLNLVLRRVIFDSTIIIEPFEIGMAGVLEIYYV